MAETYTKRESKDWKRIIFLGSHAGQGFLTISHITLYVWGRRNVQSLKENWELYFWRRGNEVVRAKK